jgi:hypothetical protein
LGLLLKAVSSQNLLEFHKAPGGLIPEECTGNKVPCNDIKIGFCFLYEFVDLSKGMVDIGGKYDPHNKNLSIYSFRSGANQNTAPKTHSKTYSSEEFFSMIKRDFNIFLWDGSYIGRG